MAEYDVNGLPRQVLEGEPETTADSAEPDSALRPWYRSRVLLALWMLMVALLLTLIIYGMVELSRGGGTSPIPAPHSSTTSTQSSTTTSAPTTPSTTGEAPPPGTPEQTPEEAPPPPANNSPAPGEPPHHHHHPHLPSTIPLPHTTITLPHGI
jgi:hypothetical protein